MKAPCHILDDWAEPELLIGLLSRMDAVVSMRLHGLIFSSLSGAPLVGVSYDPKIQSFLRYLGAGTCNFPGGRNRGKLEAGCGPGP